MITDKLDLNDELLVNVKKAKKLYKDYADKYSDVYLNDKLCNAKKHNYYIDGAFKNFKKIKKIYDGKIDIEVKQLKSLLDIITDDAHIDCILYRPYDFAPDDFPSKKLGEVLSCCKYILNLISNSNKCVECFEEKIQNGLMSLERSLDIVKSYADNKMTYQYARDYGDKIKVISKRVPFGKHVMLDRNEFKSYSKKLCNSISRSNQAISEIIQCNEWEYFATFTINKQYFDRYNLEVYMKAFRKWLSNYSLRKNSGNKIDYILVPEQHRNGAWHIHGLINGLPREQLSTFEHDNHKRRQRKNEYLNWSAYENKFGFCSLEKIKDKEAVAAYISRQIKDLSKTQGRKLNSNLYYVSKGLKRSQEIARGYNLFDIDDYDYENEFTAVKWFKV